MILYQKLLVILLAFIRTAVQASRHFLQVTSCHLRAGYRHMPLAPNLQWTDITIIILSRWLDKDDDVPV